MILFLASQLWELNDEVLQNKEGLWKSNDTWNFKAEDDDLIYIENTSKTKVLGTKNNSKVILKNFEENKPEQLWKKGEPIAEGYFTLENLKVSKFMTATSSTSLELKGNMNKVDNA